MGEVNHWDGIDSVDSWDSIHFMISHVWWQTEVIQVFMNAFEVMSLLDACHRLVDLPSHWLGGERCFEWAQNEFIHDICFI